MKVFAIFVAILAVALAAPSEVANAEEKVVVLEKTEESEKPVQKEEVVKPLSESSKEDKVVEKVEDKPSLEVSNPEEKPPVVVVATSLEDKKTEEETATDQEIDVRDICRASTGATQEQITAIGKNPVDDAPKVVKCYIKCLAEQSGVEKDQVLQKDVVRRKMSTKLTAEELETAIETCSDLKTDDPCDSAYLRYSCYFRTTGEKIRVS